MKFLSWSLLALLVALPAASGDEPPPAHEAVDLLLPGKHQRLRLEVVVEGQQPEAAWGAFLDRWFDYFDRDGDGTLSAKEAALLFPLPLPGRQSVAFDFARADANKDGKITRAELKAFYRGAGFVPVLTAAPPASPTTLQVAEALFRHLGPDVHGQLTPDKLKRATELLRKLDENADDVLTPEEVLSLGADPLLKAPQHSNFGWAPAKPPAPATVRLVLNTTKAPALRVEQVDKAIRLLPVSAGLRLRLGDVVLALLPGSADAARAVALTRQFCLAQFKNAAGNKAWLEKAQVEDDAALQVLATLFPYADRNGDGKLTREELEQFLDLAEHGVTCTWLLTLTDRGRNLLDHLDTNGDGRLDFRELHQAVHLLKVLDCPEGLGRNQVPYFARLTFQQGFVAGSFGPLPLFAPPPSPAAALSSGKKGPAWFQAMDRNGDGFVTPQEFLGPPDLFRQFDLNGDGVISVEEANRLETGRRGAIDR